jgi:very-short-patch-repair endonuclease
MDFLLLLDRHRRVVLEVDGIQHYADDDGSANTARYAEMVAADRELRLAGYEVYRFGGAEISDRRQIVARPPACSTGSSTLCS